MMRDTKMTHKDPWTPEERMEKIVEKLDEEGYTYGKEYDFQVVPNITHITYGRDVGYTIEQEYLGEDVEAISATKIRNENRTNHWYALGCT